MMADSKVISPNTIIPRAISPCDESPPPGFSKVISPYTIRTRAINPCDESPPSGFSKVISPYTVIPRAISPRDESHPPGFSKVISPYTVIPRAISPCDESHNYEELKKNESHNIYYCSLETRATSLIDHLSTMKSNYQVLKFNYELLESRLQCMESNCQNLTSRLQYEESNCQNLTSRLQYVESNCQNLTSRLQYVETDFLILKIKSKELEYRYNALRSGHIHMVSNWQELVKKVATLDDKLKEHNNTTFANINNVVPIQPNLRLKEKDIIPIQPNLRLKEKDIVLIQPKKVRSSWTEKDTALKVGRRHQNLIQKKNQSKSKSSNRGISKY